MKTYVLFSFLLLFWMIGGCSEPGKTCLYLAGDSTMQTYNESETPMRGWGQYLPTFFDTSRIDIVNHAIGGRSTKRFKKEGRWDILVNRLQKDDFVIIQFGHNDASKNKPERYTPPEDYKQYLIDFVADVRAKEAIPVLCTPIVMRRFSEDGEFLDGHGLYPDKMREVAREYDVYLIDMHQCSMDWISALGPDASKEYYMNLEAGEHFAFPEGKDDNTHMQEKGAKAMARIAGKGILANDIEPLIDFLKSESLNNERVR